MGSYSGEGRGPYEHPLSADLLSEVFVRYLMGKKHSWGRMKKIRPGFSYLVYISIIGRNSSVL